MENQKRIALGQRLYSLLFRIFAGGFIDQALRHGMRRQEGNRMEATLLREEMTAERKIAQVRMVMLSLFFIAQLLRTLKQQLPFDAALLPASVALFLALGFMLDYHYLRKERYRNLFTRVTKFMVITGDVVGLQFLMYRVMVKDIGHIPFPHHAIFPMAMLLTGTVLVLLNVYRNNPATCVYNFVLLAATFPLFQSVFLPDGVSFFRTPEGYINFPVFQFYSTIFITSLLSIMITRRTRAIMIRSKRQDQLERFLPEMVAQEVLSGDRDISAGGTRHTVSILFADIRNFTTYSEQNTPEEVIDFLNAYFNDMISVIFKYNGTLDKIIGDGLMAIFGAPFPSDEDAANAVRTAVDMQRKLRTFNELRALSGQPEVKIGIGIHTGEVILGNVGSAQRYDFTVIGDAVNTASRLEGLTKVKGEEILFSAATRELLPAAFRVRSLGTVHVKGRQQEVEIYTVDGVGGEAR